MKKVLILLMFFVSISCFSQKYTLIEINAKWNEKNNLTQEKIGGIRVNFAWLEDQTPVIQKSVKSVPTLILMKNGRPIYQWKAGIDFKLEVTEEDFEKVLNKLNNGKN